MTDTTTLHELLRSLISLETLGNDPKALIFADCGGDLYTIDGVSDIGGEVTIQISPHVADELDEMDLDVLREIDAENGEYFLGVIDTIGPAEQHALMDLVDKGYIEPTTVVNPTGTYYTLTDKGTAYIAEHG